MASILNQEKEPDSSQWKEVIPGRPVALQLLHQQLAAATQDVPQLPQRAAALEGSTAVLRTNNPQSTRQRRTDDKRHIFFP
ncbi:hypothetical protein EYF80_028455 [Liparis tanakae]|uniref:Uncharacterized protein n=1 Tax=Liparis tanakae TaxID=230148 RepID=A0A4Z2H623_9TELE|nr:hypothetical protein EYF80_028455 [Liparis tanakae]